MAPFRLRRLPAGVAVSLYAFTGCALAVSQYTMLAPRPASAGHAECAPSVDGPGFARAVAARIADLRYGPGPEARLVPIASEGALQALIQAPPAPAAPPSCRRA